MSYLKKIYEIIGYISFFLLIYKEISSISHLNTIYILFNTIQNIHTFIFIYDLSWLHQRWKINIISFNIYLKFYN